MAGAYKRRERTRLQVVMASESGMPEQTSLVAYITGTSYSLNFQFHSPGLPDTAL